MIALAKASSFLTILTLSLAMTVTAVAGESHLTFYVPFNGNVNAQIADGSAKPHWGGAKPPQFVKGISGKGLIAGKGRQSVSFNAKGNISPDQWTITFWVKGLKGADWNSLGHGMQLQMFWQLFGKHNEILWFYKYPTNTRPRLFYRTKYKTGARYILAPKAPEQAWHYWAVTWSRGQLARLYLDGRLVGQGACESPNPVQRIVIGGSIGLDKPNKIIDEFKIYDTALTSAAIAKQYHTEGGKLARTSTAAAQPEQVIDYSLFRYPSRQQIRLKWVIQSDLDPSTLSLDAQLKNADGNTLLATKVAPLPSLTGSKLIDMSSIPAGDYTLTVQTKNKQKPIRKQSIQFKKQPLPDWWHNTLGLSKTPPPPWTDVKVSRQNDSVSIWGRTYDYHGHLLPVQITNQHKTMLAGPMHFVVRPIGHKTTSSSTSPAGSVAWTKTTATRAASKRSQIVGPVRLSVDSYVDFDGMVWMQLTVAPVAGKVKLGGLDLAIPLKKAWAKLIRPWNDYHLQHTGALPAKGWHGNAMKMPWIGNGDGGIQFFQQSVAHWIGDKTIDIVPGEHGNMVVKIHLINKPTTLHKPLHLALGWITSPVKSSPKNERDWRCVAPSAYPYLKQAKRLNPHIVAYSPWWQGWWWLPPGDYKGSPDTTGPLPVPAKERVSGTAVVDGMKIFRAAYGRMTEMGADNPWFRQFGDEWLPTAAVPTLHFMKGSLGGVITTGIARWGGGHNPTPGGAVPAATWLATVSQASRSLRDFYAWGYNQLLEKGDVHALYFDVSDPLGDSNIYHGAGAKKPDGTVIPELNILGMRKTFRRIYTLLKKYHPHGRLIYHMSGHIMLPIDSFCDAMLDGENYVSELHRTHNRGYEHVLSLTQFRTEYSAQNNFGPATLFLPEFGNSGSIKPNEWKTLGYGHANYVIGLVLLHDSRMWWGGSGISAKPVGQAYLALDKVGWDSTWTFIPYWHQTAFPDLPKHVVASLYLSPDKAKAVVIVMNVGKHDQRVDLPLSGIGKMLNHSHIMQANPLYPGGAVNLDSHSIRRLLVKSKRFRMFLVR